MSEREKFEDWVEAHLHESRAQLGFLQAKRETARPDGLPEFCLEVERLELLLDDFVGKFHALQTANDQTWEKLRDTTEQSCDELKAGLSNARMHYFPLTC